MKELTDEQYREIGRKSGKAWASAGYTEDSGSLDMGRAAYAVSFPYAVAEALAEPTNEEANAAAPSVELGPWEHTYSKYASRFLANRLSRLTAKPPDPAVEAVKRELGWYGSSYAEDVDAAKIVAAVRKADGAKEQR